MSDENKLHSKVAVITGAAQGLGEAIAKEFAKQAAKVILVDINAQEIKRVKSDMEDEQLDADIFITDVCDSKAVNQTFKDILKKYKKIDILVNAVPGAIAFTVIPYSPTSLASSLVIPKRPAFAAPYGT